MGSLEGDDFWQWLCFLKRTAPCEQLICQMLIPNIEAAWKGYGKTWTLSQAKSVFKDPDDGWDPCYSKSPPKQPGQPTPGVFVWRNKWFEERMKTDRDTTNASAGDDSSSSTVATAAVSSTQSTGDIADPEAHLHESVKKNLQHFFADLRKAHEADGCEGAPFVGVLLEYSGADVKFMAKRPLAEASSAPDGIGILPETCITMLGGPKGISSGVVELIRQTFKSGSTPLLEIALGEQQQMAHVCMGHLRIADASHHYKSTLTDLYRLGPDGYKSFMLAVDDALPALCAASAGQKRKLNE